MGETGILLMESLHSFPLLSISDPIVALGCGKTVALFKTNEMIGRPSLLYHSKNYKPRFITKKWSVIIDNSHFFHTTLFFTVYLLVG